jgi:hypothetical protein
MVRLLINQRVPFADHKAPSQLAQLTLDGIKQRRGASPIATQHELRVSMADRQRAKEILQRPAL